MTNRRRKGLEQIGKAARLALRSIQRARKDASGGDERPEQIQRDQPSAPADKRGPAGMVPTVGRPAIRTKEAE